MGLFPVIWPTNLESTSQPIVPPKNQICTWIQEGNLKELDSMIKLKLIGVNDEVGIGNNRSERILVLAAYYGQKAIVNYLLEKGANPNISASKKINQVTYTPLDAAADGNQLGTVILLVENKQRAVQLNFSYYPMIYATKKNNLKMVKYLCKKGASGKEKAIVYAAAKNRLPMVKYLFSKGAPLKNVLLQGILRGHKNIVDFCLKNGMSLKEPNILEGACQGAMGIFNSRADLDFIRYLIAKGAKITPAVLDTAKNICLNHSFLPNTETNRHIYKYLINQYAKTFATTACKKQFGRK